MPDKKLTDSEIVKALEMLLDKIRAYECKNVSIDYNLIVNIIDLINRQKVHNNNQREAIKGLHEKIKCLQAENERLKEKVNRYSYLYDVIVNTPINRIKTEVLQECAEILKEKMPDERS